jgi:hypothetical protein
MSKRPTMNSEDCGNMKRKQLSLSIKQKVELLMKIQNPENPKIQKALVPRLSR